MRAIRLDIFGPRVPKAARPSKRSARAQAPRPAPKPARATSGRPGGKAPRVLHVTEGALAGTKVPLDGTPITIGRAPGSTLLLTDDYVSSHHARIFSRDGAWLVEDMGSTNGTFVGAGKVTGPTPIGPGAKVRGRQDRPGAAQMTLAIRYAARSDVGLLRPGNEDAAYAGPHLPRRSRRHGRALPPARWPVRVAISSLVPLDDTDRGGDELLPTLERVLRSANERLREMVTANQDLEGMGTTVTALAVDGQQLGLVHIGDSRAYLYADGRLTQITRDHTLVQRLVDEGRIARRTPASTRSGR
jgi:hypothetical protein